MSTMIRLQQGSPEWHAHRGRYRNASETAAVLGVSPWLTPYMLWELRTGRRQQDVSPAMRHGSQLEPKARAAYEALTGLVMQPLVLVEGEYSASLDGLTLGGDLLLEIKCPYKGRASRLWQSVETGDVPEHYHWQVQHQLMVSGADMAHLYVFDGQQGLLVETLPKPTDWRRICAAWDAFAGYLASDTPPPLTDRDTRARSDPVWVQAAQRFIAAKQAADAAAALADQAKAALVTLAQHPSESGAGVGVTRYWKQGAVDYKRVPQLQGVDLDAYRKAGSVEVRVSVGK